MKDSKIYWTDNARFDLLEIIEYIKNDSLPQAKRIYTRIKNESLKLSKFPNIGRNVPELERYNLTNYRELIVEVWRIIYTQNESGIFILSVIDSRRDLDELLFEKLFKS